MVKMNRGEPAVKFLSDLVKGTVHAETPDGCNYDYGMAPYEEMSGGQQPGSTIPETRSYGARSGVGKKTSVV